MYVALVYESKPRAGRGKPMMRAAGQTGWTTGENWAARRGGGGSCRGRGGRYADEDRCRKQAGTGCAQTSEEAAVC
jgi:hypothetical protein